MGERITAGEFHAADGVADWRSLYHLVSAHFPTGSLAEGVAFVDAIGRLVGEAEERYLTVDLRAAGVTVSLGVRDVALAQRISAAAKELGIPADASAVQVVETQRRSTRLVGAGRAAVLAGVARVRPDR